MHQVIHSFEHAFLESVKLLPVLFLVYLLIEYLEHKNNNRVHHLFMRVKKAGPLIGGLFGCIPQCGFSVIASELYSKRAITLGTLVAIFVSTSDEAIPLLLADPGRFPDLCMLILVKLIIALVAGFLVDVFAFAKKKVHECEHETHHEEHHHYHGNCESCHDGVFKSAVIHALKIFVFIFALSFVLGLAMEHCKGFFGFISANSWLQPLVTPIIGIIPNCAASVFLTELYMQGGISFGALTGGLCTGAGVGLIVLLRLNKSLKENIGIAFLMYGIGAVSGFLIQLF